MRIDITALNPADNTRTVIDTALRVSYTPGRIGQLLVTTSSQKLLKFHAKSGRILSEVLNSHHRYWMPALYLMNWVQCWQNHVTRCKISRVNSK